MKSGNKKVLDNFVDKMSDEKMRLVYKTLLNKRVDELDLPIRVLTSLNKSNFLAGEGNYPKLVDVINLNEDSLLLVDSFGRKSLFDLKVFLNEWDIPMGFDLNRFIND